MPIEFYLHIGYKLGMTLQTVQTQIPQGFIDLGAGDPQLDLLPLDLMRTAAQGRLSQTDKSILQYGVEQGDGYFRAALALFLASAYGIPVSHEDLFVTSGISAGLDLLCTLFTKAGDIIFVEEPSYFLALRIFADHDLRVVSIRTDENGLVIEDLKQALKAHRPKFIYVIPAFQNPSGHTLSEARRTDLVSLAQEHDFLVLADEVYQLLNYTQTPPKSLGAAIDTRHVISLGSFSKILAPGLRLGWMHAQPSILIKLTACGMLDSGGGMNPFTSAIVRTVIESGGLAGNISRLTGVLGRRVKAMDGMLRRQIPQAVFATPHGGYFFWLRLPGLDTQELQRLAQSHQVGLRPGIRFSSRNELRDYMRLSVSFYDEDQIELGIERLKDALRSVPGS